MADQSSETVEANASVDVSDNNETIKGRKMSWAKLRRVDSLNMEAGKVSFNSTHDHPSQVLPNHSFSV